MAKKDKGVVTGDPVTYQIPSPAGGVQMETFIPWALVKRDVKRQVLTPVDAPEEFRVEVRQERRERDATQHTPLMRALGLAHYWQRLIDEGRFQTITEVATAEGLDRGQASRIAALTRLAPDIVEAIAAGGGGAVTLDHLVRRSVPADWVAQRGRLGMDGNF